MQILQGRLQSLRLETTEEEVDYLTNEIRNFCDSRTGEGLLLGDYRVDLEGVFKERDTIGYIRRNYVLVPDVLRVSLSIDNAKLIEIETPAITIDNSRNIMSELAGIALESTTDQRFTMYRRLSEVRYLKMKGLYAPFIPGLGLSEEDCRTILLSKACQERLKEICGNPSDILFFRSFFEPTTRRLRTDSKLTRLYHKVRNQKH